MNPVPTTLDRLRHIAPQQNTHQPKAPTANALNKGQGLLRYRASPEGVSRFNQTQLKDSLSARKKLNERGITAHNLISREGMKTVFGKVSTMSNIKDGFRRMCYRMNNSFERAASEFGGTHRSLIRLAGEYHKLSSSATPRNLANRLELLGQIENKLENLQQKNSITNGTTERTKLLDILLLKKFIDAEKKFITPPKNQEHQVGLNHNEQQRQEIPENPPNEGQIEIRELVLTQEQENLIQLPELHLHDLVQGEKEPEEVPEAPPLPNAPELKPYAGQVSSKDGTLKEVKNKLSKPDEPTRETSSLTWAKEEFKARSNKDIDVHLTPNKPLQPQPRKTFNVGLKDIPQFTFETEAYSQVEKQIIKAMEKGKDGRAEQVEAGKALGQLLAQSVREHLLTLDGEARKNFEIAFITSKPESLLEPILHHMGRLYKSQPEYFQTLENTFPVTRTVFKAVLGQVTSVLTNQSDKSGENITLNGVKYKKVRSLAGGGIAAVAIYEEQPDIPKDKPTRIVVKRSLKETTGYKGDFELGVEEMSKEIRIHASLEKHSSVVGFLGAVQNPAGGLMLAMELAPNGDVSNLSKKLNEAEKNGLISHESATAVRVTLLKDMVKALQHLQEDSGIIHMDLKMENFFIQEDGIAQVGDFGIAESGLKVELSELKLDAVRNRAPEIELGLTAKSNRAGFINDMKRNAEGDELTQLQKAGSEESEKSAIQVDEKADVFALGTAAYEMFTGRLFIEDVNSSATWDDKGGGRALYDFGINPSRTVSTLGTDGQKPVGFGATSLDRALNSMLHPDSTQRPSMQNLLELSVFQQKNIREDEVRNLIKLLADPTTPPEALQTVSSKIGI